MHSTKIVLHFCLPFELTQQQLGRWHYSIMITNTTAKLPIFNAHENNMHHYISRTMQVILHEPRIYYATAAHNKRYSWGSFAFRSLYISS